MASNEPDKENKPSAEEEDADDSDVEIDGMDLEGIDDDEEELAEETQKSGNADDLAAEDNDGDDDQVTSKLANEDHDEIEEARKERLELMAAEAKKVAQEQPLLADDNSGKTSVQNQLDYLLAQSEVFAHFLAGKLKLKTAYTMLERTISFSLYSSCMHRG
jgi:hypothetical protein